MNLLTNDTALFRGARTSLQALVAFVVGLFFVIWNTPGVPQNVETYIKPYELQILLWLGIPTVFGAGIIAYFMNRWRGNITSPVVPTEPLAETGTPPAA
jgi:hypothetical protein